MSEPRPLWGSARSVVHLWAKKCQLVAETQPTETRPQGEVTKAGERKEHNHPHQVRTSPGQAEQNREERCSGGQEDLLPGLPAPDAEDSSLGRGAPPLHRECCAKTCFPWAVAGEGLSSGELMQEEVGRGERRGLRSKPGRQPPPPVLSAAGGLGRTPRAEESVSGGLGGHLGAGPARLPCRFSMADHEDLRSQKFSSF